MQKLLEPDYHRVACLLDGIPFNTLFAVAVLEKKVHGAIYVDDPDNPRSALFCHPYGMLLLCGKTANFAFNKKLSDFMLNNKSGRPLWLQAHPGAWGGVLAALLKNKLLKYAKIRQTLGESEIACLENSHVIEWTRVNFGFKPDKYSRLKNNQPPPFGARDTRFLPVRP